MTVQTIESPKISVRPLRSSGAIVAGFVTVADTNILP